VFPSRVKRRWGSSCGQGCRPAAQRQGCTEWAGRFWEKVDKNGPVPEWGPDLGPCRLWVASPTSAGHGKVERDHRVVRAIRPPWELTRGPIPKGLQVMHKRDLPHAAEDVASGVCADRAQLSARTHTDDVRDAMSPGRWTRWGRDH
jgi:hypothetical protein